MKEAACSLQGEGEDRQHDQGFFCAQKATAKQSKNGEKVSMVQEQTRTLDPSTSKEAHTDTDCLASLMTAP